MDVTIYHNPRCTKSRQTLELLQSRGHRIAVVEYLKTPPDRSTLKRLLAMLGLGARELMRKKEPVYRSRKLDDPALTDEQLIQAMIDDPILMERPIVVVAGKAAIGRPPEQVLALFDA